MILSSISWREPKFEATSLINFWFLISKHTFDSELKRNFKNYQNRIKMSSNFYFTVASWFPGNGRIQPHFNTHWRGGGFYYPPIPKVLTALGRYAGNEVILGKFVMLRRFSCAFSNCPLHADLETKSTVMENLVTHLEPAKNPPRQDPRLFINEMSWIKVYW